MVLRAILLGYPEVFKSKRALPIWCYVIHHTCFFVCLPGGR